MDTQYAVVSKIDYHNHTHKTHDLIPVGFLVPVTNASQHYGVGGDVIFDFDIP